MKVLIYIAIALMPMMACSAQVEQESICGTFYRLDKDKHFSTSYTLILNPDKTFTFKIMVKDGQPQCIGKWETKENVIYLVCDEIEDATATLSSGYMSQREHELQIINKKKIKYKDVVLKRKKH